MAAPTILEKRVLLWTIISTIVGYLMQIISICTDYWLVLSIPGGLYKTKTGRYLLETYSGIWRFCRIEVRNSSLPPVTYDYCTAHNLFPTEEELANNEDVDSQLIDYNRTEIAFGLIALLLMFLGHAFAIYTYKRPRYILKRLTALLYFMTAAGILVLNEVFVNSVNYGVEHLPSRHPYKAVYHYGFSFIMSWFVFVIYVIAGLVFLLLSHKRKTEMADMEDDLAVQDEPMTLGRV